MAMMGVTRHVPARNRRRENRYPIQTYVLESQRHDRQGRDRARTRPQRPGLLPATTASTDIHAIESYRQATRPRGADPHRARPDDRRSNSKTSSTPSSNARSMSSSATTIIETGIDIPNANTLDHPRRRPLRALPSSTRSAAASGAATASPTPISCTRRTRP
ncbi:MAG: hypothetical protein MZU97_08685 [Bacillus subtilis]|nr:hypothetical protein [Bacillus subtilis]